MLLHILYNWVYLLINEQLCICYFWVLLFKENNTYIVTYVFNTPALLLAFQQYVRTCITQLVSRALCWKKLLINWLNEAVLSSQKWNIFSYLCSNLLISGKSFLYHLKTVSNQGWSSWSVLGYGLNFSWFELFFNQLIEADMVVISLKFSVVCKGAYFWFIIFWFQPHWLKGFFCTLVFPYQQNWLIETCLAGFALRALESMRSH